MGDRGNVYITSSATEEYQADEFLAGRRGIYIYSHWDGALLPEMVRKALSAARDRWRDDSYLARILIDQITAAGRDQTVGYGVSLKLGDNSHPITIVDMGRLEVAWADPEDERDPAKWHDRTSFEDFVEAVAAGYPPDSDWSD